MKTPPSGYNIASPSLIVLCCDQIWRAGSWNRVKLKVKNASGTPVPVAGAGAAFDISKVSTKFSEIFTK